MKTVPGGYVNTGKELSGYKRGYLKNDFEFFHLRDKKDLRFEYHYHDFNKVIVFISGNVTYHIEGKAYKLKPWDILIVSSREIHKPVVGPDNVYERIVIWANPVFIEAHNSTGCNLSACFELASERNFNLLRLAPEYITELRSILFNLEKACKTEGYGKRILKNALFMQFAVHLNRLYLQSEQYTGSPDIESDEGINKIIGFINEHLEEALTIDRLAEKFYISKYHLMHKFKHYTGYTIHSYILQKRLILANLMIKRGEPAVGVSVKCGFNDYSSFVRAYKKMFGLSPRNHYRSQAKLRDMYESGRHS